MHTKYNILVHILVAWYTIIEFIVIIICIFEENNKFLENCNSCIIKCQV